MITTQSNAYRLSNPRRAQWPNLPQSYFHLVAFINKGIKECEEKFYVAIKKGKAKTPYFTRIPTDPRIVVCTDEREARTLLDKLESKYWKDKKGFVTLSKEY